MVQCLPSFTCPVLAWSGLYSEGFGRQTGGIRQFDNRSLAADQPKELSILLPRGSLTFTVTGVAPSRFSSGKAVPISPIAHGNRWTELDHSFQTILDDSAACEASRLFWKHLEQLKCAWDQMKGKKIHETNHSGPFNKSQPIRPSVWSSWLMKKILWSSKNKHRSQTNWHWAHHRHILNIGTNFILIVFSSIQYMKVSYSIGSPGATKLDDNCRFRIRICLLVRSVW
jgi:hypothetical protein